MASLFGNQNALLPLQNVPDATAPSVPGTMNAIAGGENIAMAPVNALSRVQQTQLGQQQIQQNAQALQRVAQMRSIFSDPSSLDPRTGLPTIATVDKIMAVDPESGLKVQQFMQNAFSTALKKHVELYNIGQGIQKDYRQANTDAWNAYNQAIHNGASPQAAQKVGQAVYDQWRDGLAGTGLVDSTQDAAIPRTWNPNTAPMVAAHYQQVQAERDRTLSGWKVVDDVQKDGSRVPFRYNAETGQATTPNGEPYTIRGKVEKQQGQPMPGSPAATHLAVIEDLKNDPAYAHLSPGQLALEAKRQEGIASGTISTPAQVREVAEQIASYQAAPLTNYAMARPAGQAIMAEVRTINPNYQAAYYGQFSDTLKKFGSGTEGNRVRFLNVAVQHLNVLQDAIENLGNHDVRALNAIRQKVRAATGVDAPVTFDAVKSIVGTEIEKAVAGGIGAVADRDRLLDGLSRANSPQQLLGVIQQYKRLMAGQAMGLKQQYEQGTPDLPIFRTGSMSFDSKLLPATEKELGMISGAPPSGAAAAASPSGGKSWPSPPAAAITQLRQTPGTAAQFDEIFGPGAAERVLGPPGGAGAPASPAAAPPPTQGAAAASTAASYPVPAAHAQDPDGTRYQGSDGKVYVKQGQRMIPAPAAPGA